MGTIEMVAHTAESCEYLAGPAAGGHPKTRYSDAAGISAPFLIDSDSEGRDRVAC